MLKKKINKSYLTALRVAQLTKFKHNTFGCNTIHTEDIRGISGK